MKNDRRNLNAFMCGRRWRQQLKGGNAFGSTSYSSLGESRDLSAMKLNKSLRLMLLNHSSLFASPEPLSTELSSKLSLQMLFRIFCTIFLFILCAETIKSEDGLECFTALTPCLREYTTENAKVDQEEDPDKRIAIECSTIKSFDKCVEKVLRSDEMNCDDESISDLLKSSSRESSAKNQERCREVIGGQSMLTPNFVITFLLCFSYYLMSC